MVKYLIIGNGVAGTTAAENIRANDPDGEITIVTDEDLPFYYRIRLNDCLAGEIDEQELIAKKEQWYLDKNIDLKLNTRITGADPADKSVHTANSEILPFDKLLIATGSHPFIPSIKGNEKKNVHTLHTILDVRNIALSCQGCTNVVLIGGGLLGIETGFALSKLGKEICIVEFFPRLLPRQLDTEGAGRLCHMLEEMNFTFRLGAVTKEITGTNEAEGILLEDGELLPAQTVIISAGVRPNLELAEILGLAFDKGIKVDKYLQTSQPDIYGAGDVIEYNNTTYGLWTAALEQGKIAGINMAGGKSTYKGTVLSSTLKVAGIDLASAGNIDEENQYQAIIVNDADIYKKVVLEEDRAIGCIMLGDKKISTGSIRRLPTRKRSAKILTICWQVNFSRIFSI
jgi:nitrite reductase (NADH) large subunit